MSHLWLPLVTFLGGALVGAVVGDVLRRRTGRADTALSTLLGVAILLTVGYIAFATYAATAELARVTDCQTQRNAAFTNALEVRADATRVLREAQDALIDAQRTFLSAVTDPAVTPARRQAAFGDYFATLDAVDVAITRDAQVRAGTRLDAGGGGCR